MPFKQAVAGLSSSGGSCPITFLNLLDQKICIQFALSWKKSELRVALVIAEHRRWRPPYQTGKAVHVHAKRTHRDNMFVMVSYPRLPR